MNANIHLSWNEWMENKPLPISEPWHHLLFQMCMQLSCHVGVPGQVLLSITFNKNISRYRIIWAMEDILLFFKSSNSTNLNLITLKHWISMYLSSSQKVWHLVYDMMVYVVERNRLQVVMRCRPLVLNCCSVLPPLCSFMHILLCGLGELKAYLRRAVKTSFHLFNYSGD